MLFADREVAVEVLDEVLDEVTSRSEPKAVSVTAVTKEIRKRRETLIGYFGGSS